jgi:hypothetical protein
LSQSAKFAQQINASEHMGSGLLRRFVHVHAFGVDLQFLPTPILPHGISLLIG